MLQSSSFFLHKSCTSFVSLPKDARDECVSRNLERPKPWPVSMLGKEPPTSLLDDSDGHPFFPLKCFSLLTHPSLSFPSPLLLSRNYYNPAWTGLRRLKNVIVLLEWTPDTGRLALVSGPEHTAAAELASWQEAAIARAHGLLVCHHSAVGSVGGASLSRSGLASAVLASTGEHADEALLDMLMLQHGDGGISGGMSAQGLRDMLVQGSLRPEHRGRYWVAVSLAEAETLRRVLHLRKNNPLLGSAGDNRVGNAEIALHLSQPAAAVSTSNSAGESPAGRVDSAAGREHWWAAVLDTSCGWRGGGGTGATAHEATTALGCFRFFDGDMHFTRPTLFRLVRALQKATTYDREKVRCVCE
jgi:hypothetical protein